MEGADESTELLYIHFSTHLHAWKERVFYEYKIVNTYLAENLMKVAT